LKRQFHSDDYSHKAINRQIAPNQPPERAAALFLPGLNAGASRARRVTIVVDQDDFRGDPRRAQRG
ncbi:hypothetical protein, partial [uncultured Thiocystis sp.]|uniref:hypothetical protein n=1 Tax=uncultured Thiocystis sp. TaxID=1202134 RepID=UPI0025D9F49F